MPLHSIKGLWLLPCPSQLLLLPQGFHHSLYAPCFLYSLCLEGSSPPCPSLKLYPKATCSEGSSLLSIAPLDSSSSGFPMHPTTVTIVFQRPCHTLFLRANHPSYSLAKCTHVYNECQCCCRSSISCIRKFLYLKAIEVICDFFPHVLFLLSMLLAAPWARLWCPHVQITTLLGY